MTKNKGMKIHRPVYDLVEAYVKAKYPRSIVAVIYVKRTQDAGQDWVREFVSKHNLTEEIINGDPNGYQNMDIIVIEFDKVDDASDFCHSVPDSAPYCSVLVHGQVITENT